MSNVTPPAGAGAARLTVKAKFVVPALPSFSATSLIDSRGRAGGAVHPAAADDVDCPGRNAPRGQVGVVVVGIDAVREPGDADERGGGRVTRRSSGTFGIRGAGISLVGHRIDEGAREPETDGVGGAVLDEVGIRSVVEVAVDDIRRVGADHVVTAGGEAHVRQDDGVVDRRAAVLPLTISSV